MSTPHRIGYLVPNFPSQTHAFFWREMNALGEQAGREVPVVSTARPPHDACKHDFASAARARTTYLLTPGALAGGMLGVLRSPAGALRGLRRTGALRGQSLPTRLVSWLAAMRLARWARAERIEHLHVHSAANAAGIAMIAKAIIGLPYSVVLHGDPEVYGSDHDQKMGAATCVIPVTNPLAERIGQEGWVDPGRLFVVTMGIDSRRFSPDDSPKDDPPLILTVARLNKTKGIHHALEALARLRNEGLQFRYLVLGEGPYRETLAQEVERLGLGDLVSLPGTASQDEVLAALRRASVFSLTSFGMGEAAPVSVMEAMAVGLPVVVSRIGGSPDMIDSGTDGLLTEQQDVDSIAAAYREVLGSAARRAQLGAAARERAARDFDDHVLAGRVLGHIRACAGGSTR
ncbi:MAG: glycosyltransferase family 4 protein [Planctomycetota bacterium]